MKCFLTNATYILNHMAFVVHVATRYAAPQVVASFTSNVTLSPVSILLTVGSILVMSLHLFKQDKF